MHICIELRTISFLYYCYPLGFTFCSGQRSKQLYFFYFVYYKICCLYAQIFALNLAILFAVMFNRPCVARAGLKTPGSLNIYFNKSVFLFFPILSSTQPGCWGSKGVTSVTEVCICKGARELNFWENVDLPPHGTCHMSCDMYDMSHSTTHLVSQKLALT